MKLSPTARTLAELRKRGHVAQVVERYNPYARVRVDLFGAIDLVYLDGAIVGVQATSGGNHAGRRDKILAEPRALQWLQCGGRLEIWSFAKQGARGKRKTWQTRVEPITAEMFETQQEVAA